MGQLILSKFNSEPAYSIPNADPKSYNKQYISRELAKTSLISPFFI